jgi:uncharacterized protein YfiM (DUF2279 family)
LVAVILALPGAVAAQSQAESDSTVIAAPSSDRWFAQDKVHHFAASGFLSGLSYYLAREQAGMSADGAVRVGIGFTMALGVMKELRDIRHGTPSWKDLVADLAGAVAVAVLLRGM